MSSKPKGVGRGGYRPGAGRKTEDGAVIAARISATITQAHVDLIREFNPDNDTVGLRAALDELIKRRQGVRIATQTKTSPAPERAPQARKSILRMPTKVEEPTRPARLLPGQAPDWDD